MPKEFSGTLCRIKREVDHCFECCRYGQCRLHEEKPDWYDVHVSGLIGKVIRLNAKNLLGWYEVLDYNREGFVYDSERVKAALFFCSPVFKATNIDAFYVVEKIAKELGLKGGAYEERVREGKDILTKAGYERD